jgi:hypothetical protein
MNVNIIPGAREIFAALREDEFTSDSDSRAGGCRVVEWVKTVGERRLEVQLWADGRHRVTHWLNGRMCTLPTYFTDVPTMRAAIAHELARHDHPPVERPYSVTQRGPFGRRKEKAKA